MDRVEDLRPGAPDWRHAVDDHYAGLEIAAFVRGDAGLEIGAGRHPRHKQDSHNQQANDSIHNPAIIAPSNCRGERQCDLAASRLPSPRRAVRTSTKR